jgi:transposase
MMAAHNSGKPVDLDAVGAGMEGAIRDFVRRDGPNLRRAPDSDGELVTANITAHLQRIAGSSIQEIDRLIAELQTLRNRLHTEAARVQREITEYAHLSHAAMRSTKIIGSSLASWKQGADPRANGRHS